MLRFDFRGGREGTFQTADTCNIQSHSNFRRRVNFEAGIYLQTARENIAYCFPVDTVTLFGSHFDAIKSFPWITVSDWTVALNTWNTTRGSDYAGRREDKMDKTRMHQTPFNHVKFKQNDLEMMELDTINLEEVGVDECLTTYEKMLEASASDHSIDMPQAFRVGLFLMAISRR